MTPSVTRHAIRRYAERVLRIELPDDLTDDQALAELRARDVDLVAIVHRLRDTCRTAVELGATGVRAFNARIVLDGRTVVSVVPKRRLWEQHHGRH